MNHSSPLPPLDALLAVLAAYRCGSFTGAADELNITHGAVSRRIGAVEHWVGAPVFERHGRGVRLTLEGQRCVSVFTQTLETLETARLASGVPQALEVVRISVVPSFARLWLLPRLSAVEGVPPVFRLAIDVQQRFADLDQVDLAVRYGRGNWPDGFTIPLFQETLVPAASPALAHLIGKSPSPSEMLRHVLIHDSDPGPWRQWLRSHGAAYSLRPQDRQFPDYDLALQAAAGGHGIVLLRRPYAEAYLTDGRLLTLSDVEEPNPQRFHLLARKGPMRRPVKLLIDRLVSQSAAGSL